MASSQSQILYCRSTLSSPRTTPPSITPNRLYIAAHSSTLSGRPLRAAVIGGGPAGSSAAEALATGGVETFLFERNPTGAKPCGGAIPLCMLDEFSIPRTIVDREVTRLRIVSPSNLTVDFGKSLSSGEFIAMTRREVLDSFLRSRAQSRGAHLITGCVTSLAVPTSPSGAYLVHYTAGAGNRKILPVDVVVGADGAHSKVAKAIHAGNYEYAIAFQERIRLPEDKMEHYQNLAEMYLGDDVSPDFYGWVFPKCDHIAVGTGTTRAKSKIKLYQQGIKSRVRTKIQGSHIIKVEAHPIPEHPRPIRVSGRVALVGDAAGYVAKCSGEGIYFAAKSGRICGEAIVRSSEGGTRMIDEWDLTREYIKRWDGEYRSMFRVMEVLQRVFYGGDECREAMVEMCGEEYVQKMTFESYMYKRLAKGNVMEDVKMVLKTLGGLVRCKILKREMDGLVLGL